MRRSIVMLTLAALITSGCSDLMNGPISVSSLGGSVGRPGSINPSQVLSVGEDLYKAATLSDEDVIKLAKEASAETDKLNPIAGPNNPYARRLDKVVAGLEKEDGLDLNFKVYLVRDVNAFSMADGSIRVFAGLMDKMSDDELRFILGHEIGHIKHGHRKARMQRAYAANAAANAASAGVKAATSSNVGGVAAVLGGNLAASLASEVIKGQFSQGDETESDEYGLQLLSKYSFPKDASVTALMKLHQVSGGDSSSSDLFASLTSTHPDSLERARHMQSMIPELVGKPEMTSQPIQVAKQETAESSQSNQVAALQAQDSQSTQALLPSDPDHSSPTPQAPRGHAPSQSPSIHNQQRLDSHEANSIHEGWYIQVGAFANRSSALRIRQVLKVSSASVAEHSSSPSAQPLYRVVVGPFDSRSHAEQRLDTIRATSLDASDAFVRRLPSGS